MRIKGYVNRKTLLKNSTNLKGHSGERPSYCSGQVALDSSGQLHVGSSGETVLMRFQMNWKRQVELWHDQLDLQSAYLEV